VRRAHKCLSTHGAEGASNLHQIERLPALCDANHPALAANAWRIESTHDGRHTVTSPDIVMVLDGNGGAPVKEADSITSG
jgi:hypothetical protein